MQPSRSTDVPVSRAFVLPPGTLGDELRRAPVAIDRVHTDGVLPKIAVAPAPVLDDASSYLWADGTAITLGIAIRPNVRYPAFLLLHEIGHFLDHRAIGDATSFASLVDARFAAWRSAVTASDAVRQLQIVERESRRAVTRDYVEYLLSMDELWARSYAQFVSIASRDSVLSGDLRQNQPEQGRSSSIPVQWHDDDFLPIAVSILELFRTLGWII